jgi:hypothetical protein
MFLGGTLWYGMMCRTFLLLERILRSVIVEFSSLSPDSAARISRVRAGGKPTSKMTFGDCVAVAEELVPIVSEHIRLKEPTLATNSPLLPDADLQLWKRAVFLRNRIAHHGPGFLDSVDLNAGRLWRSSVAREPLEDQADEIWRLCRTLYSSPLIIGYLAIKGIPASVSQPELKKAEQVVLELESLRQELSSAGQAASAAVSEFHASDAG